MVIDSRKAMVRSTEEVATVTVYCQTTGLDPLAFAVTSYWYTPHTLAMASVMSFALTFAALLPVNDTAPYTNLVSAVVVTGAAVVVVLVCVAAAVEVVVYVVELLVVVLPVPVVVGQPTPFRNSIGVTPSGQQP